MLKKTAFSFALAFAMIANAWAEETKLYVYLLDNTYQEIELASFPTLSFEDGYLKVAEEGIEIELANVLKAQFTPDENLTPTDVNGQSVERSSVRFDGVKLIYATDTAVGAVTVMDLAGKRVKTSIQRGDNSVTVDLSSNTNGVYIVKIGDKSFKLIKK